MPYKIRTSYKEAGIGPSLVSEEGETLEARIPIYSLDHIFALVRAFYAGKYMNSDHMSTPVEISSYTDQKRYIVRMGDLYECENEHPETWVSNKTHVKQGANICPKCGSNKTEGGYIEVEGNHAKQQMLCNNECCNESWTNIFTLSGYSLD